MNPQLLKPHGAAVIVERVGSSTPSKILRVHEEHAAPGDKFRIIAVGDGIGVTSMGESIYPKGELLGKFVMGSPMIGPIRVKIGATETRAEEEKLVWVLDEQNIRFTWTDEGVDIIPVDPPSAFGPPKPFPIGN